MLGVNFLDVQTILTLGQSPLLTLYSRLDTGYIYDNIRIRLDLI